MPTPTMSDEELDALFQRGAAAYPDEMPAAAWARMEAKLDDAARTQLLRRKVGRFFAGELLLIALVLWQVIRITPPVAAPAAGPPQPAALQAAARATAASATTATRNDSLTKLIVYRADTTRVPSSGAAVATELATASGPHLHPALAPGAYPTALPSTTPGRLATPAQPLAQPAASAKLAATAKASESARAAATKASLATLFSAPAPRPQRAGAARQVVTKNAGSQAKMAVSRLTRKPTRSQQLKATPVFASVGGRFAHSPATPTSAASLRLPATASKPATVAGAGEPLDSLAGRAASLPVARYPLPDLLRQLAVPPPAADTAQPPRHRAPRPPYRVVVGVLAGPSFSGVRTAQTARLGIDYGLTLEYRFSPRWRVRAGLLSSQKNYLAASNDYEAPAAWQWFGGTYDLTANCRITEIPLDLRYDVLRKPAYTLFTSLGFNSLLMRDERYSYDWTMNGQTFTKSAEVRKGSNHFLSALNVSVGFEKPLGQRWSAQVEPFWQFPLGGVGAGKVRLTSAGASFSLKFGLVK